MEEALEAQSEIEWAEVAVIQFEQNRLVFTVAIEGISGKMKAEVNV